MADKMLNLRVFEDDAGKMNLSLLDVGGSVLSISQFTLYASCRHGRRPSFSGAAEPGVASRLYDEFNAITAAKGVNVQTGEFGAEMLVEIHNDGPVTIILDSDTDLAKPNKYTAKRGYTAKDMPSFIYACMYFMLSGRQHQQQRAYNKAQQPECVSDR